VQLQPGAVIVEVTKVDGTDAKDVPFVNCVEDAELVVNPGEKG
jgi:hypothetical protein